MSISHYHHHHCNCKTEITTSCYGNTEAGSILECQGKHGKRDTREETLKHNSKKIS